MNGAVLEARIFRNYCGSLGASEVRDPGNRSEFAKIAEFEFVAFKQIPALFRNHLRAHRQQIVMIVDGNVVVVHTDSCLANGEFPGRIVCDGCCAQDAVRGAVDIDPAMVAQLDRSCGTVSQKSEFSFSMR